MARKKEFDTEDAMGRATELFRQKGYVAASIDDLTRATGLSRSSLYDTFGNKEQLFAAVLAKYRVEMMARLVPDPEVAPAVAMEGFLLELLDAFEAWGPHAGCLITTTCSELTNTPDAIQRSCTAALQEQDDQLRAYFTDAVNCGALPAGTDVAHLAAYFVAMRQSIGLLWRAGEPRDKLAAVITLGTQILPTPRRRRATTKPAPDAG
jgi:AcrR family transcriptional regulator